MFAAEARALFESVYQTFLVAPIRRMYILGPDYIGWSGKTDAQICSIITNTPEHLWAEKHGACEYLIQQKLTSILVVIETLVYFYLVYLVLYKCGHWLCRRGYRWSPNTPHPTIVTYGP
jgi:hypothetical protein